MINLATFAVEHPAGLGDVGHDFDRLCCFKHPFSLGEVLAVVEVSNVLSKDGEVGAVVLVVLS